MNNQHLAEETDDQSEKVAVLNRQIRELMLECSATVADAMARIAVSHQKMKLLTEQVFELELNKIPRPGKHCDDGDTNG